MLSGSLEVMLAFFLWIVIFVKVGTLSDRET